MIGRASGDRGLAVQHALLQFGIHWSRRRAILAAQEGCGFFADDFVSLLHQHVQHSLCPDDLGRGRHQRHEAQVFANAWNFRQHLIDLSGCALFAELILHVAEHPAGHLRHEYP